MEGTPVSETAQETKIDKVEIVGQDKVETPVNDGTQSQTGQVDVPTPLAKDQGATEISEEDKDKSEETSLTPKPKELEAIQALVTLPELGTPSSQTLHKLSTNATPLQFLVSSPISSKEQEVITYGDVSLDEEIVLPKFDYATIIIQKVGVLQEALAKKKHQELLRRGHRQKKALIEIKEIFLDAFNLPTPDETKPIIEQLNNIVERVSDTDLDTNIKLLEWSEKKFQNKVNEKIYSDIALRQVALETKIDGVKKVLENIFSLYTKLCNPTLFTQEIRNHILSLEIQIQTSSAKLPMFPAQSEKHFRTLLQSQSQLASFQEDEANIRC